MINTDHLFHIAPWATINIFKELSLQLKQEYPVSNAATAIAFGTSEYEDIIRDLWEEFKKDPTEDNAIMFIETLKDAGEPLWEEVMVDLLGVSSLSDGQHSILQEQWANHTSYLDNSLLPDIIKGIREGQRNFDNLDYRVVFLYAGALWSFGFLSTIVFDGLNTRDLGDLFIFLGPNDEETCTGERGCQQFANKIFTVAEIITRNIIPGKLRCLTNCRHMLLPIASPLNEIE